MFVLLRPPQNESSEEEEEEDDDDENDDDEDDVDDDEEEEAIAEGEVDPTFRLELMKVLQKQNALVGCVEWRPITSLLLSTRPASGFLILMWRRTEDKK